MVRFDFKKIKYFRKNDNARKRRAVLAIIFGSALVLVGTGYIGAKNGWFGGGAVVPEDTFSRGLAGYWSFDEGKGNIANDASGNGNNGILASGPKWTDGKDGNGLQFNGKNTQVNVPDAQSLRFGSGPFTVEVWFKINGNANLGAHGIINKTGTTGYWGFYYSDSNKKLTFQTRSSDTNEFLGVATAATFEKNVWHHVVWVINDASITMIANGKIKENFTDGRVSRLYDQNNNLNFGNLNGNYLNGVIDDVRIYGRALSEAEVKYHYNHGGPVGYWNFDEGSGTVARDLSGNNNQGSLTSFSTVDSGTVDASSGNSLTDNDKVWAANQWVNGKITITSGTGSGQTQTIASNTASTTVILGAWSTPPDATSQYSLVQENAWTSGRFGNALQFDGKDDYVDVPTAKFDQLGAMSVCTWVNPRSISANYSRIIQKGDSSGTTRGFGITQSQDDGKLVGFYQSQYMTIEYSARTSQAIANGQWAHVCMVYDGSGNVAMFLNGSNSSEATPSYDKGWAAVGNKLNIGRRSGEAVYLYNGLIDDLKIYAYARSADEIRLDYQAGMAALLGPSGKTCSEDPVSCMDKDLAGYWSFDEMTGTVAFDKSGNGNRAYLTTHTLPKWVDGKYGSALAFNGKADTAYVGNASVLNFGDGVDFSVGAWFKSTEAVWLGNIVGKGDSWGNDRWQIYIRSSNDIAFANSVNKGANYLLSATGQNWFDGKWHFVMATIDRDGDSKIYMDGVLKNTKSSSIWGTFSSVWGFEIGHFYDRGFKGMIDEVKVYRRALTAEEVKYQYDQGAPAGYWKFDEGSGMVVGDSSGNNNDGVITGATWTDGKYGGALIFDGIDDKVSLGNGSNVNLTTAFTLEAWVKNSRGVSDTPQHIISKKNNYIANSGYMYYLQYGKIYVNYGDGSTYREAGSSVLDWDANTWYHVVAVFDGTNEKMYRNGILVGSVTKIGSIATNSINLQIGDLNSSYYFQGSIDEPKIYNYARTDDQIRQDYQAGVANYFGPSGKACREDPASCMDKGLVGYWDMNEGNGVILKDKSSNGNNGLLVNGPKWTVGKNGGALQLDGRDDYVSVIHSNSLDLIADSLTVETWINSYNDQPNGAGKYIFSIGKGGFGNGGSWELRWHAAGNLFFFLRNPDNSDYRAVQTSATVSKKQWHHFVATFDGAAQAARIYIDGVERETASIVNISSINTNTSDFVIGSAVPYRLNGFIDDVRVYNRALSAEEVRYHYNQGEPVAYWNMDEGSGAVLNDVSGNHNRGSILGASWVQGKYGSALSFDGVDDYVDAGTSSIINLTADYTIGLWVKTNTTEVLKTIYRKNYATYGYRMASLNFPSIGKLAFASGSGADVNSLVSNASNLNDGSWRYVVFQVEGTTQKLYVDGILDNTRIKVDGSAADTGFTIGYHTNASRYFNGQIDDVRVYNYARSAEQIKMDYQQGVATHLE